MNKDFFQHKASVYETDQNRVSNVDRIANAIKTAVDFKADMHLMDFGSGTGLLLERIAPWVKKITAVDISPSMNQQLEDKRDMLQCELEILPLNLVTEDIPQRFDGIISSMTLHHVQDVEAMFGKFYEHLNEGGFVAIADLDSEDGSFHTEDTGVFHHGFDRNEIEKVAKKAGFSEAVVTDASVVVKPHGDYPVFLLVARKA